MMILPLLESRPASASARAAFTIRFKNTWRSSPTLQTMSGSSPSCNCAVATHWYSLRAMSSVVSIARLRLAGALSVAPGSANSRIARTMVAARRQWRNLLVEYRLENIRAVPDVLNEGIDLTHNSRGESTYRCEFLRQSKFNFRFLTQPRLLVQLGNGLSQARGPNPSSLFESG